jgi:chromosome segregation ATPase
MYTHSHIHLYNPNTYHGRILIPILISRVYSHAYPYLHQMHEAQDRAARATNELAAIKQVHSMFGDELKVHKQLQEGLKKEVEAATREAKVSRDKEQSHIVTLHQKHAEVLTLKQQLAEQEGETRKAQNALEATVSELELLSQQKNVLKLQWEDALKALRQRDKATGALWVVCSGKCVVGSE